MKTCPEFNCLPLYRAPRANVQPHKLEMEQSIELPHSLTECEMFDVLVGHELFGCRWGIRASLGNLKQEEEGRQRRRFDDHIFLTPSVSKGNRRHRVGWNKGIEDVSMCFNVESKIPLFHNPKSDFYYFTFSRERNKVSRSTKARLFGFGQKAVFVFFYYSNSLSWVAVMVWDIIKWRFKHNSQVL